MTLSPISSSNSSSSSSNSLEIVHLTEPSASNQSVPTPQHQSLNFLALSNNVNLAQLEETNPSAHTPLNSPSPQMPASMNTPIPRPRLYNTRTQVFSTYNWQREVNDLGRQSFLAAGYTTISQFGISQRIQQHSFNGLRPGILCNSNIVVNSLSNNQNPAWLQFCNKIQTFIMENHNPHVMMIRLEAVITHINNAPELQKQINRLAEESTVNCTDGAYGSFIEMEKTIKKHLLIESIEKKPIQEVALGEVIELAHGFYMLEVLENIANDIGQGEAVEVFLYLLKEYSEILKLPIPGAAFTHQLYLDILKFSDDKGETIQFSSNDGQAFLQAKIYAAQINSNEFSKSLANFTPFHVYLNKYASDANLAYSNPSTSNTEAQINHLKYQTQETSLKLSDAAITELKVLLPGILDYLHTLPNAHIIFSLAELESVHQELFKLTASNNYTKNSIDNWDSMPIDIENFGHELPFELDEDQFNEDRKPKAKIDNQDTEGEVFKIHFIRDQVQHYLMRLYNNADKICYFSQAKSFADYYVNTLIKLELHQNYTDLQYQHSVNTLINTPIETALSTRQVTDTEIRVESDIEIAQDIEAEFQSMESQIQTGHNNTP